MKASYARAATRMSEGWVSPLFGISLLHDGREAVRGAWADAGREGRPRIMTGRYFSLGANADATADVEQIHAEMRWLEEAGCDDVGLFPCSGDLEQVSLLAHALPTA